MFECCFILSGIYGVGKQSLKPKWTGRPGKNPEVANANGLDEHRALEHNGENFADVAELADAQVSGTCGLTPV